MKKSHRICSQCVMDTSDPNILFDANGVCCYCINFNNIIRSSWNTGELGIKALNKLSENIRRQTKKLEFDCIIGLSGGLDSSYAAYIAKEKMKLNPLLFHVDAGWNTDRAVGNIEKLVDGLNLELYTEVIDWDAVRRMQVAFLKSGIPDQDLVQDAAFFSSLYKFAKRNKIKHVITGANFSTECCREPEEWGGYLGCDKTLFNAIWAKHGDGKSINKFPSIDILTHKIIYQKFYGMKVHQPLNFVPYVKKDAERELSRLFGWEKFQHKHHESRFTRFYEDFWLPKRFGYDKRKAHFSSLIMTKQMSRDEALERLSKSEMDENFLLKEFEYIANKLNMTAENLSSLFQLPLKTYKDFKNKRWLIRGGAKIMRFIGKEKRYFA